MKKKQSLTAAEFVAQLQQDPEYVRQQEAHQQELAALAERRAELLEPVLADLARAGYSTSALDDLVRQYAPLPENVSTILLGWLPRIEDPFVQEQLVRALAAGRRFDGRALVALFERTDSALLRWAIANTIAQARPEGVVEWLRTAVVNRALGDARQMLPLALARLDEPVVANAILREVFDELPGHVALAWAESGGVAELNLLRNKRNVAPKDWVRKEIDKAIRAIELRTSDPSTDKPVPGRSILE